MRNAFQICLLLTLASLLPWTERVLGAEGKKSFAPARQEKSETDSSKKSSSDKTKNSPEKKANETKDSAKPDSKNPDRNKTTDTKKVAAAPACKLDKLELRGQFFPQDSKLKFTVSATFSNVGKEIVWRLEPTGALTSAKLNGKDLSELRSTATAEGNTWRVSTTGTAKTARLDFTYEREVTLSGGAVVLGEQKDPDAPLWFLLTPSEKWFPEFEIAPSTFVFSLELPGEWIWSSAVGTENKSGKSKGNFFEISSSAGSFPTTLFCGTFITTRMKSGGADILFLTGKSTRVFPLAPNIFQEYFKIYSECLGKFPAKKLIFLERPEGIEENIPGVTALKPGELSTPAFFDIPLRQQLLTRWLPGAEQNFSEALVEYFSTLYWIEAKAGEERARDYRRFLLKKFAIAEHLRDVKAPFAQNETGTSSSLLVRRVMAFHSARETVGAGKFKTALKKSLQKNPGWASYRKALGDALGKDGGRFLEDWLDREGAPEIVVESAVAVPRQDGYEVILQLSQSEPAYSLRLNVLVETVLVKAKPLAEGEAVFDAAPPPMEIKMEFGALELRGVSGKYSFFTKWRPRRLVVDPQVNYLRRLSITEMTPSFHVTLAQPDVVIVCSTFGNQLKNQTYREMCELLGKQFKIDVKDDREISFRALAEHSLLILGDPMSNELLLRLRAKTPQWLVYNDKNFFSIHGNIYKGKDHAAAVSFPNPFNPRKKVTVVFGLSPRAVNAVVPALFEHGWEAWEVFEGKQVVLAGSENSTEGFLEKTIK